MGATRFVTIALALAVIAWGALAYIFTPTFGSDYALNAATVRQTLTQVSVPRLFTEGSTLGLKLRLVENDPAHVAWDLYGDKGDPVRIVARLETPAPDATRVTVGAVQPALGPQAPNMFVKAAINKLFESAFKEEIAARLERRAFETYRLAPDLAIMMAINLASVVGGATRVADEDRKRL